MSKRTKQYELVGWVGKELVAAEHLVGELPGKQAVFIDDEFGDQHVAYCARAPKLGTRVGLRGRWLTVGRTLPDGTRLVQYQLNAKAWEVVSAAYDAQASLHELD